MDFVEIFHGQEITVTTARAADGRWTAAARYAAGPGKTVEVDASPDKVSITYATEAQARAAALESAAEAIDRDRTATGKR